MRQRDQRQEAGEELTNKGPSGQPLSRGLRVLREASAHTQGEHRIQLCKRSLVGRKV